MKGHVALDLGWVLADRVVKNERVELSIDR